MENHEQRSQRWREQEARLAGYVAVFALGVFLVYFFVFWLRGFAVGNPESWAEFGDYFGGIVNPVVGIVTVILVIRTLHATRAESDLTRLEMRAQTALFTAQLERYDKEKRQGELQKRLDGALAAWDVALSQQRRDLRSELLPDSPIFGVPYTFRQLFNETNIEDEINRAKALGARWTHLYEKHWADHATDVANLLKEIGLYCDDYDHEAGNKVLTDFYRRRVSSGLRVLNVVGLVQSQTFAALRIGRLSFVDS